MGTALPSSIDAQTEDNSAKHGFRKSLPGVTQKGSVQCQPPTHSFSAETLGKNQFGSRQFTAVVQK